MAIRIYQKVSLAVGAELTIVNDYHHYLANVLRVKTGEVITIFNGEGGEYLGEIKAIAKKSTHIFIQSFLDLEAESPLQITLAQGIAKGEKMDFIVQKAVELGVNCIVPLLTERTNVKLSDERLEKRLLHWESVAISACEQSGRNRIPAILAPIALEKWLAQPNFSAKFLLSPQPSHPETKSISFQQGVTLLIGPEGGLSEKEAILALNHGFNPLNLGPRILRTETATLAAITFFQCNEGDMRG
jgi:16S rRNA (uracil1498-N3)-methyltransferase